MNYEETADALDEYVLRHIDPEPEVLHTVQRLTHLRLTYTRMCSGHLQGRMLKMLCATANAHRILELGTFSGYSAISMAQGLEEGGMVYTFEIDDELEDFTRPWIEGSSVADKIRFLIGDAIVEAPRLGVVFDMVFLDGDKRTYVEAYEMALRVVRRGAFILADNTLWDGHVVDGRYDHDAQTLGIRRFNDHVARDDRVEKVIVPVRDGLTLIHVLP